MSDDFATTSVQPGTTQGDLTTANVDKNQPKLELKPSDSKASEVSLKILTSETELSTPKSLDAHRFDLGEEINNENESASLEKADSVSSKTLPQSNEIADSTLDKLHQDEVHVRSKIDSQLNGEISLSDQIKSMSEVDDLIEAMSNPEFADHLDEIMARMDELEQEAENDISETDQAIDEIKENLSEVKETITQAEENIIKMTEQKSELQNIEAKETGIGEVFETKATQLHSEIQFEIQNLFYAVGNRAIPAIEVDIADRKKENVIYKDLGSNLFIAASKENTKRLKEGKLEFKNENGVYERQRHDARDMTDEEKKSFDDFISSNFATIPTNAKEETHTDENKNTSSQYKYSGSEELPKDNKVDNRVETNHEKQTTSKTNVEGTILAPILRNYQKAMKELRHKEEKIKKEVQNHEILINNIKQNNLKIEVNDASNKAKEIKRENEKLNQEYADLYKEFLEVSTHIEVPEPLREKFLEEIKFPAPKQFAQFDEVINHSNGHVPVLKAEIMAYKKEVMKTIQSALKDTGSLTNVRLGKQ